MEQLDPNDLLIFATVVDAGSFTAAANRLGMPKATVSRRVSQLENRLGERLMLRTTRRLSLTEFGSALLEHARQIASEVDAAAALAQSRQARPSGRLRVSMPADVANPMLVDMLTNFATLYPAVRLELDLSPRRVDLLAEHFDLVVRVGELPDDSLLAARKLADFPNALYAAPSYLAEQGEPRTPDELRRHRSLHLMARGGEFVGWTLQRDAEQWHCEPAVRVVANSPELLIRMACAGAGITAAPQYSAQPHVQSGELRPVLPDWRLGSATAWAVFPGRRLMPAKTRAFLEMLVAAFGESR